MGPEAEVERRLVQEAREAGWTVRKLAFLGTRGAPDRIFGKAGRSILIEFKAKDGRLSKQQTRRQVELIRDFGLDVRTCYSLESGRQMLDLEEL